MPVKKKKKSKIYFGQKTEDAIIRYNKCDKQHIKNRIYEEHIDAAFNKLAENLIHTFKFYYFDVPLTDVKHEVVAFLLMNMHKYVPEKGKAFSYFSIVGKNWLILHNNNNYKKMKQHTALDVLDFKRNIGMEEANKEEIEYYNDFVEQMVNYWENNLNNFFKRKKDLNVAYSVLELFKRRSTLENFNKKALYILVREMTGSNTQHITRIVNQMKQQYLLLNTEYQKDGTIDTSNTGSIFA
tara:strand:- start:2431 stop:3150 length:720 start_codon:yes stop_codon:yes gene_type:complete